MQGMGVSAAAGLRPFLPTLLVGALASADLGVDFDGTDFAFLESTWWFLALVIALVVTTLLRRYFETGPGEAVLGGVGLGLGALLFAGTLDDRHATWWPGATSRSSGSTCAHCSIAIGQRVLNRHPEGGLIGVGTSPCRMILLLFRLGSGMGIADNRACV